MSPRVFLPLRSDEPSTQSYLENVARSYDISLENECFGNAYVNAHMIFIYWLYCKLLICLLSDRDKIGKIFALHRFDSSYRRDRFLSSESALEFHKLKLEERKYADVFGSICLDVNDVKTVKSLVDKRNNILHPSGFSIADEATLGEYLEKQRGVAIKISDFTAPLYITAAEAEYGKKISRYRFSRWESDFDLEQHLVARFQLSELDIKQMKRYLRRGGVALSKN